MFDRYQMLMAFTALLLGACSSGATDSIALSPEIPSENNLVTEVNLASDVISGDFRGNTLTGTSADDKLSGRSGDDIIDGREGSDTIITGLGQDSIVYGTAQIGSAPDQLLDWSLRSDRFVLDAGSLGITGALTFVNALAEDLPATGGNVIILQDSDDDNNPDTVFNARSAARLIATRIQTPGSGFFVYFNSDLGVNRLVYSPDLANGEASFSVLAAITTVKNQLAIESLPLFTSSNFSFINTVVGRFVRDTLIGTDLDDVINGRSGNDTVDGRAGSDLITTGLGRDSVIYTATQIGSSPDQLSDWSIRSDRFLLEALGFGINGPLSFVNDLAANLPTEGVNVIVLQDPDDDNNPATVFNARSAARLIASKTDSAQPGFFVYFNSSLGVNRLVFSPDLSNGEAAFTVLAAINTLSGQEAITALSTFTEGNFTLF